MKKAISHLLILFTIISCSSSEDLLKIEEQMYYPPISGDKWDTKSPENLNWNTSEIHTLLNFFRNI
jgi:hypothetical protein